MNKVIQCCSDFDLKAKIDTFAEILKTRSHELNCFGMTEEEFYESGIFEGAVQRIRGQVSARQSEKKDFMKRVLNFMQDQGYIAEWISADGANRHYYTVTMSNGRICAIEVKGCLDGNNTNISSRPPHAQEFVVWSLCQNKGSDPEAGVWSGLHVRISADMIEEEKRIDGLVILDWLCGTKYRHCPKLDSGARVKIGALDLPAPCIYLLPSTQPSPRNNPNARSQQLEDVHFLKALHYCFGGRDEDIHYVDISAVNRGNETVRTTRVYRGENICRCSEPTPLRRK